MELKEKIKREIDQMPDELLYELHEILKKLKNRKKLNRNIRYLHLQGQYDNINIRKKAYE